MGVPVEIERKFIIEMPEIAALQSYDGYTWSEIEQTYLSSTRGVTHRVRARRYADRSVYTETKKVRIDRMSAFEDEREISFEDYLELLTRMREGTRTIRKQRHEISYLGRIFEIDVYPEWGRTAVLEVELESREAEFELPGDLRIVAEVTGDKRYSNASMAKEFPTELI